MGRAARAGRWLDDRGAWPLAILFVLVVVGRAYHRLYHPQFWAEDGRNWYADAHNIGTFALLFQPYSGYLHVLPRLVAWAISWQRPDMAAISIYASWVLIQLWFASMVWRRCGIIGIRSACLIIALMSVGPYAFELHGNLSNLQWYGAVVLIVLWVAATEGRLRWGEYATAILVGLSGPLALLVSLAAAGSFVLDRRRRDSAFVAILTLCSLTVVYCILRFGRQASIIDYSLIRYPIVVGYQVGIGGIFGMDTIHRMAGIISLPIMWTFGMCIVLVLVQGLAAEREREHMCVSCGSSCALSPSSSC